MFTEKERNSLGHFVWSVLEPILHDAFKVYWPASRKQTPRSMQIKKKQGETLVEQVNWEQNED